MGGHERECNRLAQTYAQKLPGVTLLNRASPETDFMWLKSAPKVVSVIMSSFALASRLGKLDTLFMPNMRTDLFNSPWAPLKFRRCPEYYGLPTRRPSLFNGGGMSRREQMILLDLYTRVISVFEWGIGSSTLLAKHAKVPKVVGVDSSKQWVDKVQLRVPEYTIIHLDIGPVRDFGNPRDDSKRKQWPAYSNTTALGTIPFDIYLVDGRFRIACVCRAFLHGPNSMVVVHDFERYATILARVSVTNRRVAKLGMVRRNATDQQLIDLWEQYKYTKG